MSEWRSRLVSAAVLIVVVASSTASQTKSTVQPGRSFTLIGGDIPLYPQLALAARVEGTVEVHATVAGGVVTKAETKTDNVLAIAAKKNVLTWRFPTEQAGDLVVTFVFELLKQELLSPESPEIQMKLPSWVKITGKTVRPVTLPD
jgi:hypothetical protein